MKKIYTFMVILALAFGPGPTSRAGKGPDQALSQPVENSMGDLVSKILDALKIFSPAEEFDDRIEASYKVVRVVDGDTLVIDIDGKEERLRLIGIDAPESVHPDKDKNTDMGRLASDFSKLRLEGKTIGLEYDKETRDRYGRILAYVYIDGEMFNQTLLREGLAKAKTYPPNDKYEEDFLKIQEEAKANNRGLWAYENLDKDSLEYKLIEFFKLVKEALALFN